MRNFDIEFFGRASLNTLSNEELKTAITVRDVYRVGMTVSTQRNRFFIENDLEYTLPSEIEEEQGGIKYQYKIGSITGARVMAGGKFSKLMVGGLLELLLVDNYEIEGGDFKEETGRMRMVNIGPMIEWRENDFSIDLKGRFILDSTEGVEFGYLADVLDRGVGNSSVEARFNFFFNWDEIKNETIYDIDVCELISWVWRRTD